MKTKSKDDNPAKNITNFSQHCEKIVNEINLVRKKPSIYLQKLQDLLDLDHDVVKLTYDGYSIIINDGKEAILSAIEFLQEQTPLDPFSNAKGLSRSCEELLTYILLHDGMDSLDKDLNKKKYSLDKRVSTYGEVLGELDEIIDYGNFNPEMLVLGIIISDGDPYKREREILFSKLGYIGISSNILPSERVCTVLNFAERYFEKDEFIPENLIDKYAGINLHKNHLETHSRENKVTTIPKKKNAFERKASNEIYQKKKEMYATKFSFGGDKDDEEEVEEYEKEEIMDTHKRYKDKSLKHEESIKNSNEEESLEKQCERELLNEDIQEIQIFEKPMTSKYGKNMTLIKKTVYFYDGTSKVTTIKQ